MNTLLKSAIALLVVSTGAMIWGFQYRGDHPMAAVGAFFGVQDQTYVIAGWASGMGVLAFLLGIGLLVAGLMQQNRPQNQKGAGGSSQDSLTM